MPPSAATIQYPRPVGVAESESTGALSRALARLPLNGAPASVDTRPLAPSNHIPPAGRARGACTETAARDRVGTNTLTVNPNATVIAAARQSGLMALLDRPAIALGRTQTRSMMIAGAIPPPAHIVTRPTLLS